MSTHQSIPKPANANKKSDILPIPAQSKSHRVIAQPKIESTLSNEEQLAQIRAKREASERLGSTLLTPESVPRTLPPLQPKLTIGQPNDQYEQEADRVARQVVDHINAPPKIQAKETHQPMFSVEARKPSPLDHLPAQRVQRHGIGGEMDASPDLESSIQRARGGGQPLDNGIRERMEGAFGVDFSGVRVHTDGTSDQLNQSIQAKAFTTGQDVFFRKGAYEPGSRGGQELLAHELTHVVQQKGGAVQRSNIHELDRQREAQRERPPTANLLRDTRNTVQTVQRKIQVAGIVITKHNKNAHLERENGKFFSYWEKTKAEDKVKILEWINNNNLMVDVSNWDELITKVTEGIEQTEVRSSEAVEAPWHKIQWGFAELSVRILSDEGGYHLIYEILEMPDYVVRVPREGSEKNIVQGLANWKQLKEKLERFTQGAARVPEILNITTASFNEAYVVEKISRKVDALHLWNILSTQDINEDLKAQARTALETIANMFQENIKAMKWGDVAPYPDFRPSNVGQKGNDPKLIYIDFDETPTIPDQDTLKAQAMEWAGRKFIKDEGGAREANEDLWNFLTGNMLGSMSEAKSYF